MGDERFRHLRLVEALLFSAAEPLSTAQVARYLPEEVAAEPLLEELAGLYATRGVNLLRLGDRWAFRTAIDLAPQLRRETVSHRRLSRAAIDTLAIIAYHQPVTRAEIEEVRGVALSKGTLDTLLEVGWVKPRGRRRTPGRPVTWGTTPAFLDHFGLESLDALPGVDELKAAGLLDTRPAITALGERGLLPGNDDNTADEEDELEDDAAEVLHAEFGEELIDDEAEPDGSRD